MGYYAALKEIEQVDIAYGYYRLSVEDIKKFDRSDESTSIQNQRKVVREYCKQHGIILAGEYVDDDYSGGNTNRPGFQKMLADLRSKSNKVNMVITKDLSRLGRDMTDASYYAEKYFTENGINYVAIMDGYTSDRQQDLVALPFLLAANDFTIVDASRKVHGAFEAMWNAGEYTHRAPYGYMKEARNSSTPIMSSDGSRALKHHLVPNPDTAPVVRRIFSMAKDGCSTWAIADRLTEDGVPPPLKYRVLYEEAANTKNAGKAADEWNNTTVKRILRNEVYLGSTVMGKSRKVSPKSPVKRPQPRSQWYVTEGTHEPLVSKEDFELAHRMLGRRSNDYERHEHVRKSIFGGLVFCETCGGCLCSSGTVYQASGASEPEREKYWYLSCQNIPKRSRHKCPNGARIKYKDLEDRILEDLNSLLSLSEEEKRGAIIEALDRIEALDARKTTEQRIAEIETRQKAISAMTIKIYEDLYAEKIAQSTADNMLEKFSKESAALAEDLDGLLKTKTDADAVRRSYEEFFSIVDNFTHIERLTPEILHMFIDKIVVGPKIYPPGTGKVGARSKIPCTQNITIYYKYVGVHIKNDAV